MSQDRETPGRFESPSPLRVAGERRDTGRIFRETVVEVTGGATIPPGSLSAVSAALPDAVRNDGEGAETVPGGRLFPADGWQMRACVREALGLPGRRIVYSCRAPVPDLTDVNDELMFATDYRFRVGVDDLIREGCDGWLVSYGDALPACLDAVDRLLAEGVSIGLIGKATLDVPDEATLDRLVRAPRVLLVETLADPFGIGERLAAWLDARGFVGALGRIGPAADGPDGGLATPDAGRIRAALLVLPGPAAGPVGVRALSRKGLRAGAVRCIALPAPDGEPAAEQADLPAPGFLGALDHRLTAKIGPFRFEVPFAAELAQVRLVGPQAVGIMADGRPILETAANRIDVLGRSLSRIPPGLLQAPALQRLGLACSLVDLWSPLYAHWLLEGLTRLEAWEAYTRATGERPTLIIDPDPPRWVRDSLALMGVAPDDCIQWRGGPVAVERLVVCSRRREQGRVSARALHWVRERLLATLPPAPSPGPRRIFVTRADSRFRQVMNEDALMAALAPLGFERVCLSSMPWPEQLRLFRDLEAMVGAHGAGMTNIMFSTRRPLVVELFGQKVSHMNYTVGLGTGCDHRVLCCESEGDDLRVDCAKLRRLIELEPTLAGAPGGRR